MSAFGDLRLSKRYNCFSTRMGERQTAIVHRLGMDNKEQMGFYRFLNNKKVSQGELIERSCDVPVRVHSGLHILCIGDTTSFNMGARRGKIRDISKMGVIEDNESPGFLAHASIGADAATGDILGLSDLIYWSRTRQPERDGYRKRNTNAFWEKESSKWLLGADHSKEVFSSAALRTHVFDRDADKYDVFSRILGMGDDFVIRMSFNRRIEFRERSFLLWEALGSSSIMGVYTLEIPSLGNRRARTAKIELRSVDVRLKPNRKDRTGELPDHMDMTVVEAREIGYDGADPILWRLGTSHGVSSFDKAMEIIRFYVYRWKIEQLFRLMKSKGFDIELTELESFSAILRQTTMAFRAACDTLRLVYARDSESQPIEHVFNGEQQEVLAVLNKKMQGETPALKNRKSPEKLAWASWIIARLGGWKGYRSQKPPGPLTMKRGYDKFNIYYQAYELFNSE